MIRQHTRFWVTAAYAYTYPASLQLMPAPCQSLSQQRERGRGETEPERVRGGKRRMKTSMGGCVGSHHDSSGSLNENSDGTGGRKWSISRKCESICAVLGLRCFPCLLLGLLVLWNIVVGFASLCKTRSPLSDTRLAVETIKTVILWLCKCFHNSPPPLFVFGQWVVLHLTPSY